MWKGQARQEGEGREEVTGNPYVFAIGLGFWLLVFLLAGAFDAKSQTQPAPPKVELPKPAPVRPIVPVPPPTTPKWTAPQIAPDGSFVQGTPRMAPDGSWVPGTPILAPDGRWLGSGD